MNIEKTAENLKEHGYLVKVFENKEQASEFICQKLENETIGFGGSKTVEELGLYELLQKGNNTVWHWKNPVSNEDIAKYSAYITSANAVSESGELVNIDGNGNRLSASLYGSKKLFFVVGENKIVPSLHDAIERAQNIAAPMNSKRLNSKTPCAVTGKCENCNSPSRICRALTIYFRPMLSFDETWVLIIKEQLGF